MGTTGTIGATNGGLRTILEASRLALHDSLVRVATGSRIVRAADDPAGLVISQNLASMLADMDAEFRRLERTDAVSRTVDGALGEVSDLLVEARGLAVAAADETRSADERTAYQVELDSIVSTIDRIGASTTFAGRRLFDGALDLVSGSSSVRVDALAAGGLGAVATGGTTRSLADLVSGGAAAPDGGDAGLAAEILDEAANDVAVRRGELGAFLGGAVETRMRSLSVAYRNMAGALSGIADADMAAESTALARAQVLHAGAVSMLALAGGANRTVLGLLGLD